MPALLLVYAAEEHGNDGVDDVGRIVVEEDEDDGMADELYADSLFLNRLPIISLVMIRKLKIPVKLGLATLIPVFCLSRSISLIRGQNAGF